MLYNIFKTCVLMIALGLLFLTIGWYIGGQQGVTVAFVIALVINAFTFFFSDKIVLSLYRAKPLDRQQHASIYEDVNSLCTRMNIPMPKLFLVQSPVANAFATGRNPKHAAVALTTGIISILDEDELKGVLAHELSHVKNRDTLIATIAATMATAIGYLAYMARYLSFFGHTSNSDNRKSTGPLGLLIIGMVAPIAATLVQLGISRSREYAADESGAHATQEPLALAAALQKLADNAQATHVANDMLHAPTRSLGIAQPFTGNSLFSLFSTHPPTRLRIKRLHEMQQKIF